MKMSEKQTSEEKEGELGMGKQKWSRMMRDTETLVAHRGKPIYKAPANAATWVSSFHLKYCYRRQNQKPILMQESLKRYVCFSQGIFIDH